jgi:myo-inositol 2-dehydrogenase/D-chiro-inositol 1-dehydrogenase
MSDITIGLIGCGGLGRTHAECISKIPGSRVIAFADIHEPAAQKLCADFNGEYATTDAQRVIDDPRVGAIYICTRHDSHAALAIASARAGKHVMIEKPLALNLEDCQQIAVAVKTAGTYLMPAFKLRYYPLIQKAHEFIPTPQVVVGQIMDNRWADTSWAQDPVQGGANVHSQGCHATDIIRYLSNSEPARIWAAGGMLTHPGHPCIDHCMASIAFANGNVGSWINGDAAVGHHTSKFFFQIFGDGKSVQIFDRMKKATFSDGQKVWTEERPEEEGFLLENREFIAALREKREPALTAHDGIQATRIVLAADRAIRTGQVQEL